MVEFLLPPVFTKEMADTIPEQRTVVDTFFLEGKLLSYTLAADRQKLWAIFMCHSESELIEQIESLPMTVYFEYRYHEVLFHEMVSLIPTLSLN
ncbi:MAG: hypothetical protein IPM42_08170 [Saprospiraceae bacterium]|nr:hypothetical protein [Saprospiraceae bacterium]